MNKQLHVCQIWELDFNKYQDDKENDLHYNVSKYVKSRYQFVEDEEKQELVEVKKLVS